MRAMTSSTELGMDAESLLLFTVPKTAMQPLKI